MIEYEIVDGELVVSEGLERIEHHCNMKYVEHTGVNICSTCGEKRDTVTGARVGAEEYLERLLKLPTHILNDLARS